MAFVGAMLVMATSGALMAAIAPRPNPGNVMGGVLAAYFVVTGLHTTRRRAPAPDALDVAALLVALAFVAAGLALGVAATRSATGRMYGYRPGLYFGFATAALLAAVGDARVMWARGVHGRRRVARHLLRMCAALWIATASFFLGQARAIPRPLRVLPVLATPVVLVLVLMLYWLVRTLYVRRQPRRHAIA
jgi:hypothetical protein